MELAGLRVNYDFSLIDMRATPRHDAAVIKHTAKQWVTLRLHQEYLLLADESLKELHRIRSFGPIPAGTVPVITVAHNELARLPVSFGTTAR